LYEGVHSLYYFNESTSYSADGMVPSITTTKDEILSGEDLEIVYYVTNTASGLYFSDITMIVEGGFFNESLVLGKLNANSEKELLRKRYRVPFVDEDIIYEINVTLDYLTSTREKKQINLTKNLRVTSNGTIITINQMPSVQEVYTGQEMYVDVNVNNMKEETFNLIVSDVLPATVEFIGGLTSRNFELEGGKSDIAYSYKIRIPENYKGDYLNITSTVSIPAFAYTKSDSNIINVKKSENVTASSTNDDGTSGSSGEGDEVENSEVIAGIDVKGSDELTNVSVNEQVEQISGLKKFFRKVDAFFSNLFS
jgi:hypothetical protein